MDKLLHKIQSYSDKLLLPQEDDWLFYAVSRENSSFAGNIPNVHCSDKLITGSRSYQQIVNYRLGE